MDKVLNPLAGYETTNFWLEADAMATVQRLHASFLVQLELEIFSPGGVAQWTSHPPQE
jgi:hypothetical protein